LLLAYPDQKLTDYGVPKLLDIMSKITGGMIN